MIRDTMEALNGEIEYKADGYARIIRNLQAQAESFDAEIRRMTGKRDALKRNAARLKNNLQISMELVGKEKFKTDLFSFGIQNNPLSVVLEEQYLENLPEEYLIPQEPKVDKKKLIKDLKAGKDLKGIAHLQQTRSLHIR